MICRFEWQWKLPHEQGIKLQIRGASALLYLVHTTEGAAIDLLSRLPSKFEGAARLVHVFRLMNRNGMAVRATDVSQ